MGGMGMGAAGRSQQGGMQGQIGQDVDASSQAIERRISEYLDGNPIKSILTPGEYCEWSLTLKAGQVVVADASSEAFDPALEICDAKDKSLANNDDRYPGDQRPLLLWRCPSDGAYSLRARCFHDKSGGQVFVRFRTYDSVDLTPSGKVEHDTDGSAPFLLRIPMKAGQIKSVFSESGDNTRPYLQFSPTGTTIAPNGLPDIGLGATLQNVMGGYTLLAPVAGDYYVLGRVFGQEGTHNKIRLWATETPISKFVAAADVRTATAKTNVAAVWQLSVKAGEVLQSNAPELSPGCRFVVAEEPDLSHYDLAKPDTNPFFPHSIPQDPNGPAIMNLPSRARDGRIATFYARRDAKLWVISNAAGPGDKSFTLRVAPAARSFAVDVTNSSKLRIGDTEYWSIDANAGDVMDLNSSASDYAQQILVRDPSMNQVWAGTEDTDSSKLSWRMIAQQPGRYLVAVSCLGNGGAGSYSLNRRVFHAKEFGIGKPATGEIGAGQVQIWKFTATPEKPLYIHWHTSAWAYGIATYDDKGGNASFERQIIDGNNAFGILTVDKPRTFVIVLSGDRDKASYSIDLGPIPGYTKGK